MSSRCFSGAPPRAQPKRRPPRGVLMERVSGRDTILHVGTPPRVGLRARRHFEAPCLCTQLPFPYRVHSVHSVRSVAVAPAAQKDKTWRALAAGATSLYRLSVQIRSEGAIVLYFPMRIRSRLRASSLPFFRRSSFLLSLNTASFFASLRSSAFALIAFFSYVGRTSNGIARHS